jgi:uncharacterized repeat protein (TIGR02543 family)
VRHTAASLPSLLDSTSGTTINPVRKLWSTLTLLLLLITFVGGAAVVRASGQSEPPTVTLNTPQPGANQLSGWAYGVDFTRIKVVIYVLTNQWYVQPYADAPFTNIASDGSWTSYTHTWQSIVVLLVDPANYTPAATKITNPALDPNVIAWTMYPSGPVSVNFSNYTWGIKTTGSVAGDQFDPGPNFWSNDPSVVNVAPDGLHLKINQIDGMWQCGEVYLTQSLGYGTYTVQVASPLDQLDQNTVAAPLFIYATPTQELDNEYSGPGGLVPSPYNAQFVVQPYNIPGNIVYYTQPATSQFTTQMEWQPDHVTFTAWNGWSSTPSQGDIIYQWTYTGSYIPPQGQERVHINLWLLNGNAPVKGEGDEMVIHSFSVQPFGLNLSVTTVGNGTVMSSDGTIDCLPLCSYNYPSGTPVTLTATPAAGWTFGSWSGCDSPNGNICSLTMNGARKVTVTFLTDPLTVMKTGAGTVTSADGNINCGNVCSAGYPNGTPVTLTATPAAGWAFGSWSGCDSVNGNVCSLIMNSARTVTAAFTQLSFLLTTTTTGSGTVISTDGDINCGSVCTYNYLGGTLVTLAAMPAQGWDFSGWNGACSGTGSCKVTMTQAESVYATFSPNCPTEPAQNVPIASGETYQGANCVLSTAGDVDSFQFNASAGDTWRMVTAITSGGYPNNICMRLYAPGNSGTPIFSGCSVTFYPPGILFVGTTQKLSIAGLYSVVLTESLNAALGYALSLERLSPAPPDGIPLVLGQNITGDVNPPTAQSAFTFYGATSGTYQIAASFATGGYPNNLCFDVYRPDGSVAVNTACTDSFYPPGILYVQANVTPTQNGTYVVVLYAAGNDATINYNLQASCLVGTCPPPATLTVVKAGTGTVTSGDGYINCGGNCSYPYPTGTPVTLTATPAQGSFFISWNGCDSVNGNICGLAADSARSVTATFTQSAYLLTVATVGSGTITSSDGFIKCPGTCSYSYPSATQVTLTATPGQGSTFLTWGGACSGVGPCQVNVTQPSTVNAFFYTPQQFIAITPCRLVDTRPGNGGNGPLPSGTSESFNLQQLASEKGCADLSSVAAYSLNVTVVPPGPLGYLTIWPTGENQPVVSTMNSLDGRIKANAAIVPAGTQGAVSVFVTDTTDVVLDIDGYFVPTSGSTLAFYTLPPCRVADTRKSTFPQGLGVPHLSGTVARDFPVLDSSCIPVGITPAAYSFNFTAVPYPAMGDPLGYLELWPTGQQPANPVSTLNNFTGTIVANAAIVPAGTGGDITAYASNDTDLVIDINGYFAPAGQGGLSLYPAVPCRVIDTRKIGNGQPFSGTLSPPVDVADSVCGPPSMAQAYIFNATVVPMGSLGYLTLWPDGQGQPLVSTLNAIDGAITSNMAIVPTTNGQVDAYASGITQLILDISSYFAP